MAPRADDLEVTGGDKRLVMERTFDQIDHVSRKVRQIAHRFVADVGAVAIAASKKMGLVDLAFVLARCGDDMHRATSAWHGPTIAEGGGAVKSYLVTTLYRPKRFTFLVFCAEK